MIPKESVGGSQHSADARDTQLSSTGARLGRHPDLLTTALKYGAGGLSIIPVDRNKKPCSPVLPTDPDTDKPTWKPFQTQAADEATIRSWHTNPLVTGFAVVGGAVSDGLLIIDFDEPGFYDNWRTVVGPLADGLPVQRTGNGHQVALRCDEPGNNQSLAWVPDNEAPSGRRVAIETRGKGGYAVLPPSLHPNGKYYECISGDFAAIPRIDMDRVNLLLAAARNLCQAPFTKQEMAKAQRAKLKARPQAGGHGGGVIQEWNSRVPIRDMLERAGYIACGDRYTRPGADAQPGGVFVFDDNGRSYHHSTNDPLHDGHAHDSFSVFCELEHNGDVHAAVRAAATELGLDSAPHPSRSSDDAINDSPPRKSQATLLVDLIEQMEGLELFHTPGGHDSEGFATIVVRDHAETWPINSKAFKRWIARQFYLECGKAPGSQALADAVNVIGGKAIYEGREKDVFVRLAELDGATYLDLADDDWRAVQMTANGWLVVPSRDVPVKFVRKRGMLRIPEPVHGGSLAELRGLVNLPHDDQWILVIAWLLAALRIGKPIPLLNINGEQGSSKSTLCKMLRGLIDPNKAPLRSPPKEERDLIIAASNSLVVGYDNLSGLPPALSDAICRLATGGGFGARELYSDDSEKLFDHLRPVIINGIDDVATRSDALDRCINITLEAISESGRRDEGELWAEYERRRPRILGGLLDAACASIRNLPTTKLARKPRMADFALWVTAGETAVPWKPGNFIEVYFGNRDEAHTLAIEASPIGPPIVAMMETESRWTGTAGELLIKLNSHHADEGTRRRSDWPRNSKAMGNALRRVAGNLRGRGIHVQVPTRGVGREKKRVFALERVGAPRSAQPASPAIPSGDTETGGGGGADADRLSDDADHAPDGRPAFRPPASCSKPLKSRSAGCADHADHVAGASSGASGRNTLADRPCRGCSQTRWWRPTECLDGWTCGACHPPLESLDVVWMDAVSSSEASP